jgi:hypothetical protein
MQAMTDTLMHLAARLRSDDGFVIGRVALVVLVLAFIIVAALVALLVPN